ENYLSPRGQAGATTWRPLYWPQFGQAICGGLGLRHARFEHSTRCGALVFHCDRRERVFERDILRLGTATTTSPPTNPGTYSSRSSPNRSVSAAHRGSMVSCR